MASMSAYHFAMTPKIQSSRLSPKPFSLKIQSLSLSHKPLKPFQYQSFCGQTSLINLTPPAKFACRKIRVSGSNNIRNISVALVETDKLSSNVRKRVTEAIDSNGGRVTIADVAIQTGLGLNEAEKSLQALSTDADGFSEVLDDGDHLYVFPDDYQSKLTAKSLRMKVEGFLEKRKTTIENIAWVLFGIHLFHKCLGFTFFCLTGPLWSVPRLYTRHFERGGTWSDIPMWNMEEQRREMIALTKGTFSLLFGDGNPNRGIEDKRWKMIAQCIASNGGVVSAKQVSPYLDLESVEEMADDGSYIQPVLKRFDGYRDQVDEKGGVLYRFPSLQRASARRGSEPKESCVEKFLEEKQWQPIDYDDEVVRDLIYPAILLNLMMGFSPLASYKIYAVAPCAIPIIRSSLIAKMNAGIDKRNRVRELCAQNLKCLD